MKVRETRSLLLDNKDLYNQADPVVSAGDLCETFEYFETFLPNLDPWAPHPYGNFIPYTRKISGGRFNGEKLVTNQFHDTEVAFAFHKEKRHCIYGLTVWEYLPGARSAILSDEGRNCLPRIRNTFYISEHPERRYGASEVTMVENVPLYLREQDVTEESYADTPFKELTSSIHLFTLHSLAKVNRAMELLRGDETLA